MVRAVCRIVVICRQPPSCRDTWAQNQSQNSNVKIYIGAAASESAAGSGYVSASILGDIASNAQRTFSSFAGVMLWDMSQAYRKIFSRHFSSALTLVKKMNTTTSKLKRLSTQTTIPRWSQSVVSKFCCTAGLCSLKSK